MSSTFNWNPDVAYAAARDGLNRVLAGVRCPEHGQQARVVGTGPDVDFESPVVSNSST